MCVAVERGRTLMRADLSLHLRLVDLVLILSAPYPSFRKAARQILVSPWTHFPLRMLSPGRGCEFRDVTDNGVLSATKPGYFSENIGGMIPWSPVAQGQPGPLELRLVPEGILSGRVTDARGTPLENVPVTLRTLVVSNGLNHWEQRGGTTTNAEGEFRFAELQAGEYAVQTALKLDGAA
jgi:hypothetical protein